MKREWGIVMDGDIQILVEIVDENEICVKIRKDAILPTSFSWIQKTDLFKRWVSYYDC